MRISSTTLTLCCLALIATGCGPDGSGEDTGTIAAALEIPRALTDELTSVEVYVFRSSDGKPSTTELLSNYPPGTQRYEAYKEYKPTKQVTIAFRETDTGDIKGIPDRGLVWVFYALGKDNTGFPIGHGAVGPARVYSDRDYTDITIRIDPINQ